ncbi:MAG: hypothetical protein JRJ59_00020 [Deltaproteobacteria bacterium]|nr:hypothetical protein [Deltaproteobacteria bacterium]
MGLRGKKSRLVIGLGLSLDFLSTASAGTALANRATTLQNQIRQLESWVAYRKPQITDRTKILAPFPKKSSNPGHVRSLGYKHFVRNPWTGRIHVSKDLRWYKRYFHSRYSSRDPKRVARGWNQRLTDNRRLKEYQWRRIKKVERSIAKKKRELARLSGSGSHRRGSAHDIVGEWWWFNSQTVTIKRNGTLYVGNKKCGTWSCTNRQLQRYTLVWNNGFTDYLRLRSYGSLVGENNVKSRITASRI